MLGRGKVDGTFPKTTDELMNSAANIMTELVNVNNFDKKI
jgi:hypothetical protein